MMKNLVLYILSLSLVLAAPVTYATVLGPGNNHNPYSDGEKPTEDEMIPDATSNSYGSGKFIAYSDMTPEQKQELPLVRGQRLTPDHPIWVKGGVAKITDADTERIMTWNPDVAEFYERFKHKTFGGKYFLDDMKFSETTGRYFMDVVVAGTTTIMRRYVDVLPSGEAFVIDDMYRFEDHVRPSDVVSYKNAAGQIAKRFAMDSLGFYLAGNALQMMFHSSRGLVLDEKFDRATNNMVDMLKQNPDNAFVQFLGHLFNKEVFQHWVLVGDPLSLEYLNRLKPVLDPRFFKTEMEMVTEPKGMAHFASFIGINTLYGIWINNQYTKGSNYIKMNNPKYMSQQTMDKLFKLFRNNYFSMLIASVGASAVTDTAFMLYDCSITKIMSLDENNIEDKIKIDKCDDAYFDFRTTKIYEKWATTAIYQLIPAAYAAAKTQKIPGFLYNVGRDIVVDHKKIAALAPLDERGFISRGTHKSIRWVSKNVQQQLRLAADRTGERLRWEMMDANRHMNGPMKSVTAPYKRMAITGLYSTRNFTMSVASNMAKPFIGFDKFLQKASVATKAGAPMFFMQTAHFFVFLFQNEFFMPMMRLGMSETHTSFVENSQMAIVDELEFHKENDFDVDRLIKRVKGRNQTQNKKPLKQKELVRLKNMLSDYGRHQKAFREFSLENANMAMGNWKTAMMELDQRSAAVNNVYQEFLTLMENADENESIFQRKNPNELPLPFFNQIVPKEEVASPSALGQMEYRYDIMDLSEKSPDEIRDARVNAINRVHKSLKNLREQLSARDSSGLGSFGSAVAEVGSFFRQKWHSGLGVLSFDQRELISEIDVFLELWKPADAKQYAAGGAAYLKQYYQNLDMGVERLIAMATGSPKLAQLCQKNSSSSEGASEFCIFMGVHEELGKPMYRGQQFFDELAVEMNDIGITSEVTRPTSVGNMHARNYSEYMLAQMACGPDSIDAKEEMAWYNVKIDEEVKALQEGMALCETKIFAQVETCANKDFVTAGKAVCSEVDNIMNGPERRSLPKDYRPYWSGCKRDKFADVGQARCAALNEATPRSDRVGTFLEKWMQNAKWDYAQLAAEDLFEWWRDYPECSQYTIDRADFIDAAMGFDMGFEPPKITDGIQHICKQSYALQDSDVIKYGSTSTLFPYTDRHSYLNVFNGGWVINKRLEQTNGTVVNVPKTYRNLIDVIRDHISDEVFEVERGISKFGTWWGTYVKPDIDRLFRRAHDHYLDVVKFAIKPALYGRQHYRVGNMFPSLDELKENTFVESDISYEFKAFTTVQIGDYRMVVPRGDFDVTWAWWSRHYRIDEMGTVSSMRLEMDFYLNYVLPTIFENAFSEDHYKKKAAYEKIRKEQVDIFIEQENKNGEVAELIGKKGLSQLKRYLLVDPTFQAEYNCLPALGKTILQRAGQPFDMQMQKVLAETDLDKVDAEVNHSEMEADREKMRAFFKEVHEKFEEMFEVAAKFDTKEDQENFDKNTYMIFALMQRVAHELGHPQIQQKLARQAHSVFSIKQPEMKEVQENKEEVKCENQPQEMAVVEAPVEQLETADDSEASEEQKTEDADKLAEFKERTKVYRRVSLDYIDPNGIEFKNDMPSPIANELQSVIIGQTLENMSELLGEFSGYMSLITEVNYEDRIIR